MTWQWQLTFVWRQTLRPILELSKLSLNSIRSVFHYKKQVICAKANTFHHFILTLKRLVLVKDVFIHFRSVWCFEIAQSNISITDALLFYFSFISNNCCVLVHQYCSQFHVLNMHVPYSYKSLHPCKYMNIFFSFLKSLKKTVMHVHSKRFKKVYSTFKFSHMIISQFHMWENCHSLHLVNYQRKKV